MQKEMNSLSAARKFIWIGAAFLVSAAFVVQVVLSYKSPDAYGARVAAAGEISSPGPLNMNGNRIVAVGNPTADSLMSDTRFSSMLTKDAQVNVGTIVVDAIANDANPVNLDFNTQTAARTIHFPTVAQASTVAVLQQSGPTYTEGMTIYNGRSLYT